MLINTHLEISKNDIYESSYCMLYDFIINMCIADYDECQSIPCLNGGSCNNMFNAFTCDCTDRFEGNTCEKGMLCFMISIILPALWKLYYGVRPSICQFMSFSNRFIYNNFTQPLQILTEISWRHLISWDTTYTSCWATTFRLYGYWCGDQGDLVSTVFPVLPTCAFNNSYL